MISDDFHAIDPYSLLLLEMLWKNCPDLIVISTADSDKISSESKATNGVLQYECFKSFNDFSRFKIIELGVLDKETTLKLASQLMEKVFVEGSQLNKIAAEKIALQCGGK